MDEAAEAIRATSDSDDAAIREAIVAAYVAKEGGYKTLARRFGKKPKYIQSVCIEAGVAPGVQIEQPPRSIPGVSDHAQLRMREHFGIRVSRGGWMKAWRHLVQGKSLLIRIQHGNTAVHSVKIGSDYYFVVYDPSKRRIVTVLPNGRTRARTEGRR